MQITWINRGDSDRLRIVTLGWAADPGMVTQMAGYDTVCLYDYRTIEPVWFEGYGEIHLVAWSYGVWAAEQIFGDTLFDKRKSTAASDSPALRQFTTATAINGTPLPTHPTYGIAQRAFEITLMGIEKVGTSKFVQKMCSGMDKPIELGRAEAECIEELKILGELFKRDYTPKIRWTRAIIGKQDMIFPPPAQEAYWRSRIGQGDIIEIDIHQTMPHYPTEIF